MFVLQLYSISCLNTMSIPFCATYCTLSTGNQIGRKSFMEHTFCVIYFFLLVTALFAAQLSILLMNLINHICVPPTHWMVK